MTMPGALVLLFLALLLPQEALGIPVRGCEVPSPLDNLPDDLTEEKVHELFDNFNTLFEKKYETDELKKKAIENFGDNLKVIIELNKENAGENVTFGVNEFDDLSDDEYFESMVTQKPDFTTPDEYGTAAPAPAPTTDAAPTVEPSDCGVVQNGTRFAALNEAALPASFDWRTKKSIVGPVRNQGGCGCCWAFATVGVVQSAYAIKNKKLIQPSEQNLCDCGMGDGPGCSGGTYSHALSYVGYNGLSSELSYIPNKYDPQRAKKKSVCAAKGRPNNIRISAAWNIYPSTAENIQATLVKYGPVAVGFRVGKSFRHYKSGVFTGKDCFNSATATGWHAVNIVGYAVSGKTPYWIVKNSYGAGWGEKGYFRFQRGADLCYIESAMSFAVQA